MQALSFNNNEVLLFLATLIVQHRASMTLLAKKADTDRKVDNINKNIKNSRNKMS